MTKSEMTFSHLSRHSRRVTCEHIKQSNWRLHGLHHRYYF